MKTGQVGTNEHAGLVFDGKVFQPVNKCFQAPFFHPDFEPPIILIGPRLDGRWQQQAIEHIHRLNPQIWVANPYMRVNNEVDRTTRKIWEGHTYDLVNQGLPVTFLLWQPESNAIGPSDVGLYCHWLSMRPYLPLNAAAVSGHPLHHHPHAFIRETRVRLMTESPLATTLEGCCRLAVQTHLNLITAHQRQ